MSREFYLFSRNLFLVFGVMFLVVFIHPVVNFIGASDWPKSEGTIIQSELDQNGSGLFYHINISFEYRVGKQVYKGNRINYGIAANAFIFERFARIVVERYPIGKTVEVYYNPSDPADEIVERAPMGGFSVFWIVLAVSFLVGAGIITARQREIKEALERSAQQSLRPLGRDRSEIFTDHYPSAVYNPPPQPTNVKK